MFSFFVAPSLAPSEQWPTHPTPSALWFVCWFDIENLAQPSPLLRPLTKTSTKTILLQVVMNTGMMLTEPALTEGVGGGVIWNILENNKEQMEKDFGKVQLRKAAPGTKQKKSPSAGGGKKQWKFSLGGVLGGSKSRKGGAKEWKTVVGTPPGAPLHVKGKAAFMVHGATRLSYEVGGVGVGGVLGRDKFVVYLRVFVSIYDNFFVAYIQCISSRRKRTASSTVEPQQQQQQHDKLHHQQYQHRRNPFPCPSCPRKKHTTHTNTRTRARTLARRSYATGRTSCRTAGGPTCT